MYSAKTPAGMIESPANAMMNGSSMMSPPVPLATKMTRKINTPRPTRSRRPARTTPRWVRIASRSSAVRGSQEAMS